MEVGSTKLRLRLASSLVNAWEDEGLGISPHCAAKPEPGIAAPTATNSQSGGGSPESKRASSLITQSSGHGTSRPQAGPECISLPAPGQLPWLPQRSGFRGEALQNCGAGENMGHRTRD